MEKQQRWILIGGCGLAFGAAFANVGVFIQTGTSVSHLSGDISRLSINVAQVSTGVLQDLIMVGSAAVAFILGAVYAGLFIHRLSIDFSRPYGRTISLIGSLFLISGLLLVRHPWMATVIAAFACGLQNALATQYRGIILRTTHVTGLLTDFGSTLGMRLRGHVIPLWKIAVPALLAASFFLGGIVASLCKFWTPYEPILVAGIAYLLGGFSWTLFKHVIRRDLFGINSGSRNPTDA